MKKSILALAILGSFTLISCGGEEEKKEAKPKKLFKLPGGNNSTFSQIMREEMSKGSEKGPRKLNHDAYKDLQKEQAYAHNQQFSGGGNDFMSSGINWKQAEEAQAPPQSKHAKRRAKKRQKQGNNES